VRKFVLAAIGAICLLVVTATDSSAHCQVPCGIYDDEARFTEMLEHVTTIEKSMNEITRLSKEAEEEDENEENYNQIVRWVMNKENHSDKLAEIVTYYFVAQRIKPVDASDAEAHKAYLAKLELLHHLTVYAMKCKQTTDTANTDKLKQLIGDFQAAYFGQK